MKIGIVGAGQVGSSAAYAIMLNAVCSEIVLVDLNKKLSEAQATDISHGVPFGNPVQVRAGDYAELAGAAVVVIAAGVAQSPPRRDCNCWIVTPQCSRQSSRGCWLRRRTWFW